MRRADFEDVENLLSPETRRTLPLLVLLRIYLDPFVLFKNASCGSVFHQRAALAYNKAHRWVLVFYLRRWACIAGACLLALNPTASIAAVHPVFLVSAVGFGLTFTIGFVVTILIGAVYVGLGQA